MTEPEPAADCIPWGPVSPRFRLHSDPWLPAGARMSRAEFHARYERTAPDFHAELIGGVVYPRDPGHGTKRHARTLAVLCGWAGEYEGRTPSVCGGVRPTVLLGPGAEPEPDFILEHRAAAEAADDGGWVVGGPELVAEVAEDTVARDLGPKLRDYEANGVTEYLVFDLVRDRVRWHVRGDDGAFLELPPDADGLLKSREFPGLWLDPAAFLAGDRAALKTALAAGLASPEHAAFVNENSKSDA